MEDYIKCELIGGRVSFREGGCPLLEAFLPPLGNCIIKIHLMLISA